MKPTTLGSHKRKSTKIGQPYICHHAKECFDLWKKANLRVFQYHRKQVRSKQTTMILNFSNPTIFAHETADIQLA